MSSKRSKSKKRETVRSITSLFLFLGLLTVFLPFMRVEMLGAGVYQYRFVDLLSQVSAKGGDSHLPSSFWKVVKKAARMGDKWNGSGRAVMTKEALLGLSIPVALAGGYLCALAALLRRLRPQRPKWDSSVLYAAFGALYAFGGSYYLSALIRHKLNTSAGILSLVTQPLSMGIKIEMGYGVYVLSSLLVAALIFQTIERL